MMADRAGRAGRHHGRGPGECAGPQEGFRAVADAAFAMVEKTGFGEAKLFRR